MDKVLKQRLIGATILIALAVIFIPMLFDDRPERDGVRDTAIELPPAPVDRREVRRLPLNPDVVREAPPPPPEPLVPEREEREITLLEPEFLDEQPLVLSPEPAPAAIDEVVEPAPQTPALAAAVPEVAPATPAAAAAQPATAAAPAPGAASWLVQVASFSSADTANRVSEQLTSLGHAAAVDVIVRGDSRLYRVRTGPYATRADGDRARSQIATAVRGVDPVVISLPAGVSAPPAARAQAGAYSVQVGSFTARANADRLSEQLRGAGFDAFIHPDESGARPIWRVRVGALASRDEAAELRRRLLDQAGLEGLIVSDP